MAPPGSAGAQQAQPYRFPYPARRPPSILEVSHASPDATREYLDRLAGHEPRMRPRRLAHNRGAVAGFAGGLGLAHQAWHEWFWLMDDDGVSVPAGLANLLPCAQKPGVPLPLSPKAVRAKLYADGPILNFECKTSRRTLRRRGRVLWGAAPQGAPSPGNPRHFEGAFLHRDMVENIGLPDGNFFISRGAPLYGLRASGHMQCAYVASGATEGRWIWKGGVLGARASGASRVFRVGVFSATTGKSCAT